MNSVSSFAVVWACVAVEDGDELNFGAKKKKKKSKSSAAAEALVSVVVQ